MLRLRPPSDDGGQEPTSTSISPSAQIKRITVVLHGLRYGDPGDGGLQRRQLSARLADFFHLWTSGLLRADHGETEENNVARSIETLLLTDGLSALVIWTEIAVEVADALIVLLVQRATDTLNDLSNADDVEFEKPLHRFKLPAVCAGRVLKLVLTIMDGVFGDCTTVRQLPSFTYDAVPFFVYAATRTYLSLAQYPSMTSPTGANGAKEADVIDLSDDAIRETILKLYDKFIALRHLPSRRALIRHAMPSIIPLTATAIHKESAISVPRHTLRPLHLPSAIATLHAILKDALHASNDKSPTTTTLTKVHHTARHPPTVSLSSLLDAVATAAEHADGEIRVEALDVLALWMQEKENGLEDDERVAGRLAEVLAGGLLWQDAASALRIVPLLSSIMPYLVSRDRGYVHALSRPPPSAWERAARALLSTLDAHVQRAGDLRRVGDEDGEGEGEGYADEAGKSDRKAVRVMGNDSIATVGATSVDVVKAVGIRLLPRASKTVVGLAISFRAAAVAAVKGDVDIDDIARISEAICACVGVTWPRVAAYRAKVLSVVLAAVQEVECEVSYLLSSRRRGRRGGAGRRGVLEGDDGAAVKGAVRVGALTVVEVVAGVDDEGQRAVGEILRRVGEVVGRYGSMKEMGEFLLEAEVVVGGRGGDSRAVAEGRSVRVGRMVDRMAP